MSCTVFEAGTLSITAGSSKSVSSPRLSGTTATGSGFVHTTPTKAQKQTNKKTQPHLKIDPSPRPPSFCEKLFQLHPLTTAAALTPSYRRVSCRTTSVHGSQPFRGIIKGVHSLTQSEKISWHKPVLVSVVVASSIAIATVFFAGCASFVTAAAGVAVVAGAVLATVLSCTTDGDQPNMHIRGEMG